MNRRDALKTTAAFLATPGLAYAYGKTGPFWEAEWPDTDFTKSSVPFSEIFSGGVPKDGIPALDNMELITADTAELPGREPVVTLAVDGAPETAFPVRYLTWHEIVNTSIGDTPVAVTFCPLCNSALVFDRRLDGQTLSFGVSGKLRFSDMVMYDRQTQSWWQQFTGEGIVGAMTGKTLTILTSWMESVDDFRARNPTGPIMAEPPVARDYGRNPYRGYDSLARPFLYQGENPPHGIAPLMRVVRVGDRAWPLSRFEAMQEIEEAGLRLTWTAGTASALDTTAIHKGRDVGSIRVRDATTGKDVVHEVVFAFAFHAFKPDGIWMLG